jgi:hypothetical protein
MQLFILPPKGEDASNAKLVDDLSKTFRDYGIIEDGTQMQMREPSKKAGF